MMYIVSGWTIQTEMRNDRLALLKDRRTKPFPPLRDTPLRYGGAERSLQSESLHF